MPETRLQQLEQAVQGLGGDITQMKMSLAVHEAMVEEQNKKS